MEATVARWRYFESEDRRSVTTSDGGWRTVAVLRFTNFSWDVTGVGDVIGEGERPAVELEKETCAKSGVDKERGWRRQA
ncbi:hypothetical protein E3N88_13485 [Mikania micrantha]|uniref:Uncharacterized protein n=1 Tax=Mikania micrantha TaxID=192012 RepID=A0A5N6PBD9_9ASTR|nr:hypothetical protein E3N88_13485 [Mikania micrantha]